MLKKYCVHIDNFLVKKDYSCKSYAPAPLLLLTHAHADHHGRSISKFTNVVCSATTVFILGKLHQPQIVEPGQTYKHSDEVVFTVFQTIHSPGAVGFYFHSPINVLHVGDSRVDDTLLETITNIISKHDGGGNKLTINSDRNDLKYQNVFKSYPSLQTSRQNLFQLWEKHGAHKLVVAMHSDTLCLLLNDIFTPVPLSKEDELPRVRNNVIRAMSLLPKKKRKILVCGRLPRNNNFADAHPNYVFVEPSLLWFLNDKVPREPTLVSKDKRGVYRIFTSGHASIYETQCLLEAVKNI